MKEGKEVYLGTVFNKKQFFPNEFWIKIRTRVFIWQIILDVIKSKTGNCFVSKTGYFSILRKANTWNALQN